MPEVTLPEVTLPIIELPLISPTPEPTPEGVTYTFPQATPQEEQFLYEQWEAERAARAAAEAAAEAAETEAERAKAAMEVAMAEAWLEAQKIWQPAKLKAYISQAQEQYGVEPLAVQPATTWLQPTVPLPTSYWQIQPPTQPATTQTQLSKAVYAQLHPWI